MEGSAHVSQLVSVCCDIYGANSEQDLYGIWEELGGAWAETAAQEAIAGAPETAEAVPELSPQQLQLVQEQFDRVSTGSAASLEPRETKCPAQGTRVHGLGHLS